MIKYLIRVNRRRHLVLSQSWTYGSSARRQMCDPLFSPNVAHKILFILTLHSTFCYISKTEAMRVTGAVACLIECHRAVVSRLCRRILLSQTRVLLPLLHFQAARYFFGPFEKYCVKSIRGVKDTITQKNTDAATLYENLLTIQNAADLEWPATDPTNAGVRGEFLLGIFPPDRGGNHAPTLPPVEPKA